MIGPNWLCGQMMKYSASWWPFSSCHIILSFPFSFLGSERTFGLELLGRIWCLSHSFIYIYICKYLYKHTISSCFFCYNKLSVKSRSEKNMEKSIKSVENTIVVQVTFFLHNFWHYHAYYHTAAWVRAKAKTCYIKRNLTYRTNPTWRALVNTLNRHC